MGDQSHRPLALVILLTGVTSRFGHRLRWTKWTAQFLRPWGPGAHLWKRSVTHWQAGIQPCQGKQGHVALKKFPQWGAPGILSNPVL